jgi:hypothetical protein
LDNSRIGEIMNFKIKDKNEFISEVGELKEI